MTSNVWPLLCVCSFAVGVGEVWGGGDYASEVKPLLQARCYACHGGLKQKGGLRLDTVAAMRRGGESGPAVVPGAVGESAMMGRVTAVDVADRMPPEHEGEALTEAEVGVLRDWIEAGAGGPADERPESDPRDHWAFRPVVRPAVPLVGGAWGLHPIDAFMADGHRKEEVVAQPEAPAEVRLRRLTFDLIGLPPTSEEVESVVGGGDAGWYEVLVEQLLADPRHGERWGRHWMDVWRYSDWWGLGDQLRNSQKHIWHWRDWIVESLNSDVSYAEMVRQMLAADEIYPGDLSKLRATGFLARNYFLFNRNQWMEETVEHVSKGLMGLTMNCAKCHDHKYDPVDQRDYYRMRAVFEPYHVRMDGVPGEADFERDGVPRVYDGWLDEPTWRFLRGEESRPDRSVLMAPGVPGWLVSDRFEVRALELPEAAWQPERQPWVLDAHIEAADRAVAAAESGCREAEQSGSGEAGRLARAQLAVAEAKRSSVAARAEAMRAGWCRAADAGEKRGRAVRAERAVAVAMARQVVVEKETAVAQASEEKRVAGEKDLAAARESLAKVELAEADPIPANPEFAGLPGARWTPTRFKNSTADDPDVPFPSRSTGRRRALAEWMTDPRHPLTARVAVNHIWMRHMGVPLVATPFDFGRKGAAPTHPELLDWLAAEFVEHGWSQKHLHRLIVTSKVYQLSSSLAGAGESLVRDPDNRWYWRRTPGRLEAELVRDALLRHAGQLDEARGGPPVLPADQAESKRRSLYFFHSNNDRNTFLATFDAAAVKECYRREQSIVPQQALALSNSRLVQDVARAIAEKLSSGAAGAGSDYGEGGDADFVRRAWTELLAVKASEAEVAASCGAMRRWRELEPADPMAPRVNLIGTLLNHNDFLTIR